MEQAEQSCLAFLTDELSGKIGLFGGKGGVLRVLRVCGGGTCGENKIGVFRGVLWC